MNNFGFFRGRRIIMASAILACFGGLFSSSAFAQSTIKIGEINSYKAQPAFLEPYKKGMELAVEQINASGGLNGKKVELIPGMTMRIPEMPFVWRKNFSHAIKWMC